MIFEILDLREHIIQFELHSGTLDILRGGTVAPGSTSHHVLLPLTEHTCQIVGSLEVFGHFTARNSFRKMLLLT